MGRERSDPEMHGLGNELRHEVLSRAVYANKMHEPDASGGKATDHCRLSAAKQTSQFMGVMSADYPKQTFGSRSLVTRVGGRMNSRHPHHVCIRYLTMQRLVTI